MAESGKRPEWARLPAREVSVDVGYDLWAPRYDDGAAIFATEEAAVARHLDQIAPFPALALDAATGTGRHLSRIAARGARVIGIDRSAHMLTQAARKHAAHPAVDLVRASLSTLPFDAQRFDLAICALALCHFDDLSPPLEELRRVLRPGGRLLLTDFHPDAVRWGLRTEFRLENEFIRLPNPQRNVDAYLRALERAGFALTAVDAITQREVGLPPARDLDPRFHEEWDALPFFLVVSAAAV
jgi:ubiquinone/menaquinone biosynthesis C-methylase UbiE